MNKIIRENYPAAKLPDDLREGLEPGATVRVIVETRETNKMPRRSLAELKKLVDDLKSRPGFKPAAAHEAVQRIRDLRDEWDD